MPVEPLTSDIIYEYISAFIAEHDYPPTIRNIADACQLGATTVRYHLDKLEAWGWISREPGISRSLRLLRHKHTGQKLAQN